MILFAKTVIYHRLHNKLLDKGVVLTKRIAADCVNPVITERYFEITMYFNDLMQSENDIVRSIVFFSVGVLLLGITASLVFSRAITKPLIMLASAAEAFGRGELRTQVAIDSDDEVGELARTFCSMIDKRRQIEAEREALIRDLQEALAKVKLLSGFLPICTSCKKIRDDKGYWNQIESYISNCCDVEFSHGVCPECAKKLYPDLVDDNGKIK